MTTHQDGFRLRQKERDLSSNGDGTMSLPPALLNLVDQAKDALWALTACVFHPSAKVKINGRTCTYLSAFFCVSAGLIRGFLSPVLRRGWFGRVIVAAVLDFSQDPQGAWRRRFLIRLFVSRRNQRRGSRVPTFIALPGCGIDSFLEGIRFEEDQVSDWLRRCEAGYEGSGGLQEIQVRWFLHYSPSASSSDQDFPVI